MWELQSVVIKKSVPLEEARQTAHKFIGGRKRFYEEKDTEYWFRNIAGNQFKPDSFRTKKVNENIRLIYGQLKDSQKGKGLTELWNKAKEIKERFRLNPVGAPVGYNYCGPFTKLEGQPCANQTDCICRKHDLHYNRIDQMKRQGIAKEILEAEVRKADEDMLEALKYIPESEQKTIGYKLARLGILYKTKLEDAGLLPKTVFAGRGIFGGIISSMLSQGVQRLQEKLIDKVKENPSRLITAITKL